MTMSMAPPALMSMLLLALCSSVSAQSSTTQSATPTPSTSSNGYGYNFSTGSRVTTGIIAGVIIIIVSVIIALFLVSMIRRRRRRGATASPADAEANRGTANTVNMNTSPYTRNRPTQYTNFMPWSRTARPAPPPPPPYQKDAAPGTYIAGDTERTETECSERPPPFSEYPLEDNEPVFLPSPPPAARIRAERMRASMQIR